MHSILFTGHMLDAPTRKVSRFPAALEPKVKAAIYKELELCISSLDGPVRGIGAAACGSDILFHECCAALQIASDIFLALSPEEFEKKSVAFAGSVWVERYHYLMKDLPVHIMPPNKTGPDESVWENANTWMLQTALENGGSNMTLIAVWNGNPGDGKGGTQHMIDIANTNNADVRIIKINSL